MSARKEGDSIEEELGVGGELGVCGECSVVAERQTSGVRQAAEGRLTAKGHPAVDGNLTIAGSHVDTEQMQQPLISIRMATSADAHALLKIYEPYVLATAITCEYKVPTAEEFAARIMRTLERFPYLVAEVCGVPVGYAYVSPLNAREAYDWSVETSIYLASEIRHHGIGGRLHEALKVCVAAMGMTNMCALIAVPHDSDDEYLTHNSQNFHAHMGYRLVGTFDRCAQKFGRWYDMCWMELVLRDRESNMPKPIWFPDLLAQGFELPRM